MTIPVRSSSAHARDSQFGLPQGGSGLRRPTTTLPRLGVSESDELLAAAGAVDVEGRMNGDARGREIAACAAVGGEMPTGFRRLGANGRVLIA